MTDEPLAKLTPTEEIPIFKGRPVNTVAKQIKERKVTEKAEQAQKKREQYEITPRKKDVFLKEYLKNGGNATEAALKAFDCKNRTTAAAIGHNYVKQNRYLIRALLDSKGASYGQLVEKAVKKIDESKTPEWWDRVMKMADYEDFMDKSKDAPTVINIVEAQKEVLSQYVEGEIFDEET